MQKNLQFAAKEQQGLPQVQLMLNIIQRTQQHRGLCARYLQDSTMSKHEQRTKAEDLEAAIFAYEVYLDKNPNEQLKAGFAETVNYWHNIHRKVAHKNIDYTQSFEQHTYLINLQLQYLRSLVDYYQLSLDPAADGYFLIEASLMQLPELAEILGQIRGYGTGLLTKGDATFDERAHLKALLLASKSRMDYLDLSIGKAVAAKQNGRINIYENYQATKSQYQNAVDLAENEILAKQAFSLSPNQYYSAFTLGVNSYYGYAHFSIDQLDSILYSRITTLKHQMLALLFYVLCLTLVVAVICIGFVRRLLRQLGGEPYYAAEIVQAITHGDLDCEIETAYPDSLLGKVKIMQQKLKENDRLKSEFVSTVSHELRTPLTAIGGALSLAVGGQLGTMPGSALKLLDIAQKNTARLTELINDLLDIDKLSIGKLELNMSVQPLMPIIDDACLSMTSYAQKYGVHILIGPRFEYTLVNVDARRLRQVLVNFLSNAAKFSHKGDEIVINASVHADKVRIEVVDHGQGIPEEFQDKIFEKFSQVDSSDSRAAGGTGLGLAIAKELIQQMNGTIGFTSAEGVGSCFYVELPLEEANSD
ncbi:sensor histidine kinase [Cellvibrio zantedeschiae]|uniref:sensor histidine kinase n=1 Tax=Cellvibrio zantedeschiae TaxID=1237077 RepID=UPI0016796EEB|nr:HAMP domain-containing histidine kinase [Cellvibrio zantedeschiae]